MATYFSNLCIATKHVAITVGSCKIVLCDEG